MSDSIKIVLFFIAGLAFGFFPVLPESFLNTDLSMYALYLLLFFVGVGMGGNNSVWQMLKNMNAKIVLVPAAVVAGSLAGAAAFAPFLKNISLSEAMAVVSGFGYYSLSSIMITQLRGETLGVIALLSNIAREIITLLTIPYLMAAFGKLAPIAAGGATSMDTTLPVILKYTGKEYALVSIFSGVALTITAPFIISFILS